MKIENPDPFTAHRETLLLLPWYVNKTLLGDDLKAVEKHVKICQACKREIATLENLSYLTNHSDVLQCTARASFSRLKDRIHENPAPSADKKTVSIFPQWFRWLQTFQPTRYGFAGFGKTVAVTCSLLLMISAGLSITKEQPVNPYRTLANKENPVVDDNVIRVIFLPNTQEQDKETLVRSLGGKIVDGPDRQGLYSIRLEQATDSKNIFDIISLLRQNKSIIFAEPAYTVSSSSDKTTVNLQ